MKKSVFTLVFFCFALLVQAQEAKSLESTAVLLSTTLSTEEKSTTTDLTLSKTIDERDFKTMRDHIPLLSNIVEMAESCPAIASFPYTQDFSSGALPSCWSIVDKLENGQVWTFNNPKGREIYTTTSANGFVIIDSDYYGDGNSQNSDLISPVFDFTGYTNISLEFEHYYNEGWGSTATISYSLDNGASWNLINNWTTSSLNPEAFSLDLSAELSGQSQVLLKWSYSGAFSLFWAIDDIVVSAAEGNSILQTQDIADTIIYNGETTCFNAYDNITVAGGVTTVVFQTGSIVDVIAGNSIRFLPGFHAENGSNVHAVITTDSSFCVKNKSAIVENPSFEISSEDGIFSEDKSADLLNKSVKIYPNPNNGQFFVETSNFSKEIEIKVFNLSGKLLNRFKGKNGESFEIALLGIQSGLYYVMVSDEKSYKASKIVIH